MSDKEKPLFTTWKENDPESFSDAVRQSGLRDYSITKGSNTFQNISAPNVSVRQGYDRRDYDFFRPGEAIPTGDVDIIAACMQSYERIGIVRNTIDMMSEFACQGIDLVHPNPRIEAFYKQWFAKVNAKERTERILNLFYRAGNVVVKRNTAKLKPEDTDNLKRGLAADVKIDKSKKVVPMEIPWEYIIYNPLSIEVFGQDLAPFWGQKYFKYGVRVPDYVEKKLNNPQEEVDKQFVARLPKEIANIAKKGGKIIPLDSDKITALYYKKDDWQVWAKPMTFCVLEDLIMLRKMKLADLSALDGAVSHMRLWRLGSLEHRIMPTENAIARLSEMLMNNVGGGTVDLIWGPELDFKESSVEISKFLGEEKYKPVLNNIFAGLGIPPGLTGLPTSQGFSSNYISLRTLIERLQYGRDTMIRFWEKELKIVQQAMGFRAPAQVVFDKHILSDEAAMNRLLVELSDRNLISDEALQERFDLIPEIERVRLNREVRRRENDTMPSKLGPFADNIKESVKKIFVQQGIMSPADFGIDVKEPPLFPPQEKDMVIPDIKGEPGQGRPPGLKDTEPRQRRSIPAGWAEEKYNIIEGMTSGAYLASVKKENINSLTFQESSEYHHFKFSVLCQFTQNQEITKSEIKRILGGKINIPPPIEALVSKTEERFIKRKGRPLTDKEKKKIYLSAYTIYAGDSKVV